MGVSDCRMSMGMNVTVLYPRLTINHGVINEIRNGD